MTEPFSDRWLHFNVGLGLGMKPVFTSGKRKKTNIKLSNIKLNLERGEQIIVSSLSDLMRKKI